MVMTHQHTGSEAHKFNIWYSSLSVDRLSTTKGHIRAQRKMSQRVTPGHNGRCHKTTKGHIWAKWQTPQRVRSEQNGGRHKTTTEGQIKQMEDATKQPQMVASEQNGGCHKTITKGHIRAQWKMPQNHKGSHQGTMEDATKPQRVTSGQNGRCHKQPPRVTSGQNGRHHKTTTKGHIRAKWKTPQNNVNTAGAGYFYVTHNTDHVWWAPEERRRRLGMHSVGLAASGTGQKDGRHTFFLITSQVKIQHSLSVHSFTATTCNT